MKNTYLELVGLKRALRGQSKSKKLEKNLKIAFFIQFGKIDIPRYTVIYGSCTWSTVEGQSVI